MIMDTVISLYCGGQGSGCHGENCGRHPVIEDLLRFHDMLKEDPRRGNLDPNNPRRQEAALKWQREKIQTLMDRVTDHGTHSMVRESIRKANWYLEKADRHQAEDDLRTATIDQEQALMTLHEAIKVLEKYPSHIRQVEHA